MWVSKVDGRYVAVSFGLITAEKGRHQPDEIDNECNQTDMHCPAGSRVSRSGSFTVQKVTSPGEMRKSTPELDIVS